MNPNISNNSSPEYLVALVAAVLGGGAFIVAVLQALLQYLTSNNARWKCTKAAIGYANHHVNTTWSLLSWKMKIHYPLLDFNTRKVLDLMVEEQERSIPSNSDISDITLNHALKGAFWQDVRDRRLTNWHIADAYHFLELKGRPLTIWDLEWRQAGVFLKYRLRNWLHPLQRPRASWAQLLLSLRVTDVESLVITMVDAEAVYTNLDTPTQRIKLSDLGKFALVLGFHSVEINISNRTFAAWSSVASITTEEVPVVGKVLRFEGDIVALRSVLAPCDASWVRTAAWWVEGSAHFGEYMTDEHYWPLQTICLAIKANMPMTDYFEQESIAISATRKGFESGPILRESYTLRDTFIELIVSKDSEKFSTGSLVMGSITSIDPTYKDQDSAIGARLRNIYLWDEPHRSNITPAELHDCFARWQNATKSRVPTLMAAATFMSLDVLAPGFPSRVLLHSLLPWVRSRAKRLYDQHGNVHLISAILDDEISEGDLQFASIWSTYYMGAPAIRNLLSDDGTLCWGTTPMKPFFRLLPKQLQREVIVTENGKQVAHAVMVQETWDLLRHFELHKWSRTTAEMGPAMERSVTIVNLLWIQVVLIDIAIQFHIRGCWSLQRESSESESGNDDAAREEGVSTADLDEISSVGNTADYVAEETRSVNSNTSNRDEDSASDDMDDDDEDSDDDESSNIWGEAEAAVVSSIIKAWRPNEITSEDHPGTRDIRSIAIPADKAIEYEINPIEASHSMPRGNGEWTMAECFEGNPDIFPDVTGAERSERCTRLADLLELRSIFFIAFLIMQPDSSDIYLSGDDIEMPMA